MERSGFLELVMNEEIYFNKLASKIPLCSKKLQSLTSIRYMKFKVSSNQVNALVIWRSCHLHIFTGMDTPAEQQVGEN